MCGISFSHKRGPILKTCSDKCHRKYNRIYRQAHDKKSFEHVLKFLARKIRSRSKYRRNEICDVKYEFLSKLFKEQKGKCIITKIPFQISPNAKEMSPWAISIDRKDNSKGYQKDNIQLVCMMYNFCKHTWTHEDVIKFSKTILNNIRGDNQ
ncbi:MAG TPA: hypothetical protein VI911_10640 [Patescibacteria group bacterium]|nr:hypothetical protein [Patescibacteria group bacterium]